MGLFQSERNTVEHLPTIHLLSPHNGSEEKLSHWRNGSFSKEHLWAKGKMTRWAVTQENTNQAPDHTPGLCHWDSIMPVQDFCLFFEERDHIWLGLSVSIYVSGCRGMLAKDKTSSAHFPSVALCHSIRAGNSLLCYWVNLTLVWIRERTPRVKHISLCQLFSIRQQRHVAKWPPSGSDMCWHHMVCKSKQHGSTSKGSEVLRRGGGLKEVSVRGRFALVLAEQENKDLNILL